jgi:hypothetical protein
MIEDCLEDGIYYYEFKNEGYISMILSHVQT